MYVKRLVPALMLGLLLWPLPGLSIAAEGKSEAAIQQRKINIAGKQRMLSQKILMLGCMLVQGVDREASAAAAQAAISEFDHVLGALRQGDADLGLPYETSGDVIKALGRVEQVWPRFRGTAQALIRGAPDELSSLRDLAPDLLARMNEAVQVMVAGTSGGGVAELKRAIDVAGRQRMLLMKMTAEVCLVKTGIAPDTDLSRASNTMNLFETSLYNLRNGSLEDDVIEAPSWEIVEMLAIVQEGWEAMRADIHTVLMSPSPSADDMNTMLVDAMQLLSNMNEAVWMYENI